MGTKRKFFGRSMINIGSVSFLIVIIVVVAVMFTQAGRVSGGEAASSMESLERIVRKAAVQCYALEGSYPPDVQYLRDNYGLLINDKRFFVDYTIFASNIMPEIRVFPKFQSK